MIGFEQRLIICGALEAADIIDTQNIAGIVTVSRQPIDAVENGFIERSRIRYFLEQIEARNIPHYYSQLFHAYPPHATLETLKGPPERIVDEAEKILDFARACLENSDPWQKFIIHCTHGKDRSAFAGLYLLREETVTLTDALAALRRIRPQAELQIMNEYFDACFESNWRTHIGEFRATIPKPPKAVSEGQKRQFTEAVSRLLADVRNGWPAPKLRHRRGMDLPGRKR